MSSLITPLFDSKLWKPPPKLLVSDWADKFRRISPEAASEPGIWYTDRAPYQREMMNAMCDENIDRVVIMTAAQVGKTELLLNIIGYFIDNDPCPILVLQPTIQMGEAFSKDRLDTMIRDTPVLTAKVADPKSRTSGNTILHKKFTGGQITIAGSNSPASLASRPIRVLLCDEVDRYPKSAGEEGDPLSLAMKRTQNFWNRRVIWVSTPTVKGISRIEKAFANSSQEEWYVPCPNCGKFNSFDWNRIEFKHHTEPVMICEHCGEAGSESDWKANQVRGKWIAQNDSIRNIRGFHMNSFASPWCSWKALVEQYNEAVINGEEQLKVWVNTVLGIPYEYSGSIVELDELEQHLEPYDADLPEGVLVLTAGIDVQDDRVECEVVGWGMNHVSWGIDYRAIYGSPASPDLWQRLDEYLLREWHYADGNSLTVSCACVDSGGHFTDEVYKFVHGKMRRNVFAIVGRGQLGLPSVSKPTRNNRRRVLLFTLGVSTIKGVLQTRLHAKKGEAGYCHFPYDEELRNRGYDRKYFQGLLSERMIMKREHGHEVIRWEQRDKKIRNEPLDCRVYATGAYEILQPNLERRKAIRQNESSQPAEKKPQVLKSKRRGGIRIMKGGMRL